MSDALRWRCGNYRDSTNTTDLGREGPAQPPHDLGDAPDADGQVRAALELVKQRERASACHVP